MKKSSISITIGLTLFAGVVAFSSTLSWFAPTAFVTKSENPFGGTVEDAYYAYGEGTAQKPFGITRPRHLYNLAWLQYLGFYNHSNDHQYYFELAADIDMGDYSALPPIGTELNPFVGNFNGQGFTISNLHVSNTFTDYTLHPASISQFDNSTKKQPHILGLFGVVGTYTGANIQTAYSTSINELYDIGISNIVVKTEVHDSLMGLAAGYVNSTMRNVAVQSGTIDLNAATLDSTNTTSYGGFTPNISDYTLVGYSTNKTSVKQVSDTLYNLDVQTDQEFTTNLQGDSLGFGGSIDMNSVFKRLTNLKTQAQGTNNAVFSTTYDHHVAGDQTAVTRFNYTQYTGNSGSGAEGTHHGVIRWANDGSSSSKHYLLGGSYESHNYYEAYDVMDGYRINDGSGNYLTFGGTNNTAPVNSRDANSHIWEFETTTNNATGYIRTSLNDTYYYLINNNGNLRIQNVQESNATEWTIVINGNNLNLQSVYNGTTYSILYIDSVWGLFNKNHSVTTEAYTRVARNNYYLRTTSSGATFSSGQIANNNPYPDDEAHFQFDSDGYMYFTRAGSDTKCYPCAYSNNNGRSRTLYIYEGTPDNTNYRPFKLINNALRTDPAYPYNNNTNYYWFLQIANNGTWQLNRATNTTAPANIPTITNIAGSTTYPYRDYNLSNTLTGNPINTYKERENTSRHTEGPVFTTNDTTYFPIIATDEGTDLGVPKKNNTGYFVAGITNNVYSSNQDDIPRSIIVSKYSFADTGDARIAKGFSVANKRFDDSKVYTIDQNGMGALNTNNRLNRFVKYADSKAGLTSVLNKTISGTTGQVGGFHFFARDSKYSTNKNYVVNAKNVLINGVHKDYYELPVYSLDFHLKDQGFVNFFAGMYNGGGNGGTNTGSTNGYPNHMNGFFSLHKIDRDPTTEKITNIREIKAIYKQTLVDGSTKYINLYKDPTDTQILDEGGNIISSNISTFNANSYATANSLEFYFDTDWILYRDLTSERGRVFYFEIPVEAGEYCLGGYEVPGGALMDGAYLMYLDIGAGAAKINRTSLAEHFFEVSYTTTYPVGVALIPASTITNGTFKDANSVCAVVKATYVGEFTISRDANNNVVVTREASYTEVAKPSYIANTIQSVVDPGATSATTDDVDLTKDFFCDTKEVKETCRIQYYDYNVNLRNLTTTIITDTLSGSLTSAVLGSVSSKASITLSNFNRKIVQQEAGEDPVELTSQDDIDSSSVLIFKYFGEDVEGNDAAADNGRVWTSYAQVMAQNAQLYHIADNGFGTMNTVAQACSILDDGILILAYSHGTGVTVDMTYDLSLAFDSTNFKYTELEYYVIIPLARYVAASTNETVSFFVLEIDSDTTIYFFDGNVILVDGEYVYEITDDVEPLSEDDLINISPIVNPNP